MKYLNLLILSLFLFSCQKSQEYYEGIYIIGADAKEPIATLTVDDLPSAIGVNVAASCTLEEDVTIDMKAAPELVSMFNQLHKKNYEILPASTYEIDNMQLTIVKGKHASQEGLRLRVITREGLKEGKTYLLPISISKASNSELAVIEGSRTIYIVVNQIIITQAADLRSSRNFRVDFRSNSKYDTKALKNVTYEARVRFLGMTPTSNKWCFSVMGLEENFCLRTAGDKTNGWQLQLSGGVAFNSKDICPQNKWVHVAAVFNGDTGKRLVYIDGELQGEMADSRSSVDLTHAYGQDPNAAFYIGQSAADNRILDGYISEARVWAVARSAADLKNNVCWVDPLSEGLVAYWRFNESTEADKQKVTDLTGNGYDARHGSGLGISSWKPKDIIFVSGIRCPDQ